MAEIDHHLCWQACFVQPFFHFSNVLRAVVRLFTAAQNDMAIAVTAGIHNRRMPPFRYGQEAVRRTAALMASIATLIVPSVPFLKPTGRESPDASSRCACDSVVRAPIAPQLIRSARYCGVIVKTHCRWQTAVVNIKQQFTGYTQTVVDLEAIIHMRIVNQPFQPTVVRGFSK